jgi:hypothetical protein
VTTTSPSTSTSLPTIGYPPPSGDKPGQDNTGVPAGTKLTQHDGDLVITTAGAHFDALDVHGFVVVKAPNVTITRSYVRGGPATSARGLITNTTPTATNLVVEDTTLIPDQPSVYQYGLKGSNFTARRVEVAKGVDSVQIHGDNVVVEDSWLHDNSYFASDPYQGNGPSHNDGVQVLGGQNITIVGNVITGAQNAAMQVTQDYATTSRLRFDDNWVNEGTCSVKLNNKGEPARLGPVTMSGNRFGRQTSIAGCPILRTSLTDLTASGNVWEDTGAPVAVKVYDN